MLKNKTIISQAKRNVQGLITQLNRDKNTLISPETISFAISLSESIKDDKRKANQIKEDLKETNNWPFPKLDFNEIK